MTGLSNVALLAVVALLLTLAGCAQQAQTTTPSGAAPKEPPATLATPPHPQPATQEQQKPLAPNTEGFADEPALRDVFFEPDRADIVRDGATIMMANARWLLARWLFDNLDYLVLIEGHTADTGTREEKFAIAELRATAAASFLRAMNVPDARLQTISYGSDRAACPEKSDACAAKNRRVHFRMKRK